jgi:signal peptidase I
MSAAHDEEDYTPPPDPQEKAATDLAFTRMIARLWVWLCPGAGYAGAGLPVIALVSYSIWFVFYAALVVFLFTVNPVALWMLWGSFAAGLFLWLVEIVLVWVPTSRPPAPRFLIRLPIAAMVAVWLMSFAGAGLFVLKVGSVVQRRDDMTPTVKEGEQVVYLNRVEEPQLNRGTLILFRASRDSAMNNPGTPVFGRIVAVPGDRIAIEGGRYIINGETGPEASDNPPGRGRIWYWLFDLPAAPATLCVPENCYFVRTDCWPYPEDSRVLSWAERDNIVSTRIWYLRSSQFLDRVE